MTKREIKKAGYKAIFKEGISHQACFDSLKNVNNIDQDTLAEELSKIPSNGKTEKTKILRLIFILALAIILILRIFAILSMGVEGNVNLQLMIILVLLGVFVPVYGIYGALYGKSELFTFTSIFLLINFFRSFSRLEMTFELETIIVLIPFVVAVILGFIIPLKLKTPFKKIVSEENVNGDIKRISSYEFEDSRLANNDLLDSTI